MNNLRLLTGLVTLALASGELCAIDMDTSGLLEETEFGPTDNVSSGALTVRSLQELFEFAEKNSSHLRPAYSDEEMALRAIDEARSQRLPDINTTLSLSYIGDGFTTKRNFSDYQKAPIPHFGNGLAIEVNQPIYTGGAITTGIELAEMGLTASRFATELKRDNVRFSITGFYLDIFKYTNLRIVIENNIAQAKKVLHEMENRYEQGVVLQNDITRYELLVSNLELQLIKVDNTLQIFNDNIVVLAGLPAGSKVIPDNTALVESMRALSPGIQSENEDTDLSSVYFSGVEQIETNNENISYERATATTETDWIDEAMNNSPAVKLSRSQLEITTKKERMVKSDMLPKIGLKAGWNIDGPILVEVPPINRNLSYWYVGVGVSYNLSSLFKSNKTMARSGAASIHARDEYDLVCDNTALAVRSDYTRYLEAYEELKTQQKSVELSVRNYNTVYTRYTAGMALITDMLDAANAKLDAEQRLVNARINIIYYYYKLLFTSGKI